MMNRQALLVIAGLVSFPSASAQTSLPDATPGPFAPVPAPFTAGPLQPTTPMEAAPAKFADCASAGATLKMLGIGLSHEQIKQLDSQHFLLIPIESTTLAEPLTSRPAFTQDEMLRAFDRLGRDKDDGQAATTARLITPDLVLHAWHCGMARALEAVESQVLHARLATFLTTSLRNARELRASTAGQAAERLAWTEARFAAASVLLGPPDPMRYQHVPGATPQPASADADALNERLDQACQNLPEAVAATLRQEIALILAAEGSAMSRLCPQPGAMGMDYTQFKPRSHYTKSAALGCYFRAMMLLGKVAYDLETPTTIGDAALTTLVMARSPDKDTPPPVMAWKEIMEITGFFAGQSDDIAYPEFQAWLQSTLGTATLDPESVISNELAAKLVAHASDLRHPLITDTKHLARPSFHIFGQRFTWDERVFEHFSSDTSHMPSATLIPAACGDPFAEKIARDACGADPAALTDFDDHLAASRTQWSAVPDSAWFSSMVAGQLHVISTLAAPRTRNYPAFMRNDAFRAKNLVSMLGSYTELKHDTVLYSKQKMMSGEGGGSDAPPPPSTRGLVQPDVAFWRELERLACFTRDGFARHQLMPDATEKFSRFARFADDVHCCRMIAEQQIAGKPLGKKDFDFISEVRFSYLLQPLSPFDSPKPGDGKCALVTDVLTNTTEEGGGSILCEALGRPLVMLAMVGGINGKRMVAGIAYNHFEFARPLADGRLTNEEWRADFYTPHPKPHAHAAWNASITTPSTLPGKSK